MSIGSRGELFLGVAFVIAYRDLDSDLHGMNAWPASGRDLTAYLKEGDDGEKA